MQELCSYGCTAYEYNHNHHTCTRWRLWCDDGITVWNEETMSNERVHIEIFWASMKCWCLTCAVRTLQHILASAAVGSNKLLSVYLCCKMIEKTTFTVRCFFLGLPHFFLELVVHSMRCMHVFLSPFHYTFEKSASNQLWLPIFLQIPPKLKTLVRSV